MNYMKNLERHAASVAARRITTGDARTQDLYVQGGKDKPLEQLPDVQLRRGMCPRAMGSTMVCRMSCQSPCSFGRILMAREDERKASKANGGQATSAEVNSNVGQDRRIKEPKAPGAEGYSNVSPAPVAEDDPNVSPDRRIKEPKAPKSPRDKTAYMREWRKRNKERLADYQRTYRNRPEVRERVRASNRASNRKAAQREHNNREAERAEKLIARAQRTDLSTRDAFAARVELAMYNNGMTSLQLSRESGTNVTTIRNWVNGRSAPNVNLLPDLCKALNVSADWILSMCEVDSHGH